MFFNSRFFGTWALPGIGSLLFLASSAYPQETSTPFPPTTSAEKALDLADCLQMATENYRPLQLAKEEIGVAEAKAAEAARELWPSLAAKGEYTRGAALVELGTPGFTEQSYGLQASYTLFQGGGLWATFRQADANLQIARLKYTQTQHEMMQQVTDATWNLARAQGALADYQDAQAEVAQYSGMAEKLHAKGVLMKKLYLSAVSQERQSAYQIQSAQADLDKYLWKWTEALGLAEPPLARPRTEMPFAEKEIRLEECLALASAHNPEIQIQRLSAEALRYELQAKHSYDWPKLELTGFYGRSGGAYDSEDLTLKEDYNFGVKLTQPLVWNTLGLSGFSQKTSPKLGQSTLTESRTATGTFSILDGYKAAAEKREADWRFHQAEYQREKAVRDVASEVREAYYNYRKAQAQVKNSQLDLDLAERELTIQKINLRDDKATLPEVAEARNKVAGARVAMREAQAFYGIALASLNKAIGLPEHFTPSREPQRAEQGRQP
jgi:outer membrane protein TolC